MDVMTTAAPNISLQEARAAIAALERDTMSVEWKFNWTMPNGNGIEKVYFQEELGLLSSEHFILLIAEVVDKITEDESIGVQIGDLFRGNVTLPSDFTPEAVNDTVTDNLPLIKAVIKLLRMFPDIQLTMYCLALGIPQYEWDWAKDQMQMSPRRGGLRAADGMEMIKLLISQNAELIKDTMPGKANEIVDAWNLHILDKQPQEDLPLSPETPSVDSSTTQNPTMNQQATSPGWTPSSTTSPDTEARA